MNKLICGFALVTIAALLLPHTEAAASIGFFKNDAHPGKCFINEKLIMSPGESAKHPDMGCSRVHCQEGSKADISTCGVAAPPPGYKFGAAKHPNADYPECCEQEVVKA